MASSSSKKVAVRSNEGYKFQIDVATALQSKFLKLLLEDAPFVISVEVQLFDVNTRTLAKVFEYCKRHAHADVDGGGASDAIAAAVAEELKAWDAKFLKANDLMLFDLAMAAKKLEILSLFNLIWETLARRDSVEELRYVFNI